MAAGEKKLEVEKIFIDAKERGKLEEKITICFVHHTRSIKSHKIQFLWARGIW
jgi:hypothetical protein